LFVEVYWYDGRATRAASRAGYAWPGKQGPRLASMPPIRAAVDALRALSRWNDEHARWQREQEFEAECRRLDEEIDREGEAFSAMLESRKGNGPIRRPSR
jgi:hypothetical protein